MGKNVKQNIQLKLMNKKHISVDSNLSVYDPNQNTHRLLIFIHTLFLIKKQGPFRTIFQNTLYFHHLGPNNLVILRCIDTGITY